KQGQALPPLFLALATVGEESGNLPEVLAELEKYYVVQRKLRRDFIDKITWPVVELIAAIFIIAGLIYVLGLVATVRGNAPFDRLGFGLIGADGAVKFLAIVFGTLFSVAFVLWLVARLFRRRALVERLLLRLPAIGPCLSALALTRFCVALHLMMKTDLSV